MIAKGRSEIQSLLKIVTKDLNEIRVYPNTSPPWPGEDKLIILNIPIIRGI